MDKVFNSPEEAVADIPEGASIAISGFFAAGVPRVLLRALIARRTKNLTLCCGCGPLLGAAEELKALTLNGQIKKVIDSYGLFRSASENDLIVAGKFQASGKHSPGVAVPEYAAQRREGADLYPP